MSGAGQDAGEFERFRKTFFEECAELLSDLDNHLEDIGGALGDKELLNAIFRVVHSIKAGAGAFGYTALVEFSHIFEAALDELREGRIEHTEQINALMVRAGDVLATLVETAQQGQRPPQGFGSDVIAALNQLMASQTGEKHAPAAAAPARTVPNERLRWKLTFRPHAELFRHANEPLFLMRELGEIASIEEITCDTSRLPALSDYDAEESYLGWQITLSSEQSRTRLLEVFEFVEDDCELALEPLGAVPTSIAPAQDDEGFGFFEPLETEAPVSAATPAPPPAAAATTPGEPDVRGRNTGASTIRVDLNRIDRLVNMVGELVITQSMLAQQIADQAALTGTQTIRGQEDLAMLTRELQECVMAIRMQPVKSVFARIPRMVREVSSKLEKSVRLVMSGEQTEVDKTVIEELADPLTHMIRNAIDHGIERPDVRIAAGKPAEGTIQLSAAHAGSNILIHVADDGGGINRERLLAKAIEKGILPPGSSPPEEEIDELLFHPGFSTAEKVTDVSGRGVGMDVVRKNIMTLGGRIQVQSTLGKGTRFTLVIPLTLAVLDGMIVAVGRERYILPLTSILETYRPDPRTVRTITSGVQVAQVRGEYVRLVFLHEVFNVPGAIANPAEGLVVLLETAQGGKIGVVVDELIGQQQVVIKSLSDNFDPVRGISGATILGNGRVALILDIEQLSSMAGSARALAQFGEMAA
ncbi:MAG: chemotaxis protein CheA [Proteobacteria bacterium]|nr:chemotaxis protein CheA [Pseudomonadota bacterium]